MFKNFKHKIIYLSIGLLVGCLFPIQSLFADNPIKLIINGKTIQCDVPPQNVNGRVLVPARYVAENLNASVDWDGVNNAVVITSKSSQISNQNIQNQQLNNINTSKAKNEKSNSANLQIGQTYDNGKIKITVSDFNPNVVNEGGSFVEYKVKFEPYSNYCLMNKSCFFSYITDNDKYNSPQSLINSNLMFGNYLDFGISDNTTMSIIKNPNYKIKKIKLNLEGLDVKDATWNIEY